MNKNLRISIVVPVYNEEEQLAACLEAIASQTIAPYEVLVVDNNSTDDTVAIASRFPFVHVLHESRQGVIHARSRGFNAATGDIIARIDGDSLLPADWLASIVSIFSDKNVAAVSGAPHYYDFAFAAIPDRIDGFLRRRLARKLNDTNFLYGANMALRRSAWCKVRNELCIRAGMHEDFDLAIHLQQKRLQVVYDEKLVAGVSSRRIDTNFRDYLRYTLKSPQTYAQHNLASRRHMYPVLLVCWVCYVPGRLLYRGYNTETGGFSLVKLLATTVARVDPTANVI